MEVKLAPIGPTTTQVVALRLLLGKGVTCQAREQVLLGGSIAGSRETDLTTRLSDSD